ncbi:MAG: hypothetical protein GX957_01985 [Clostridiaceae bacterium]|nr:hypothetical protein [Clostridiaceae bacterium]
MDLVCFFTVLVVLIIIVALCFFEFFKVRSLYRKKYNKKLLYKQYAKAVKIMQDKKIAELLNLCEREEFEK